MKSFKEFFSAAFAFFLIGRCFSSSTGVFLAPIAAVFQNFSLSTPYIFINNILTALLMLVLGRFSVIFVSFILVLNGGILGLFWAEKFFFYAYMLWEITAILITAECARKKTYKLLPLAFLLFLTGAWLESPVIISAP